VSAAVVLFTRDLRVEDHPALAAACAGSDRVLPLFVFDDRLLAASTMGANRLGFLVESLADLRGSLRARGGDLFLRRGDPAAVAVAAARAAGATTLHCSGDVTASAQRRQEALRQRCATAGLRLELHPGVTVVEPAALRPSGDGDHYRVFTPYWRAWCAAPRRPLAPAPDAVRAPDAGEPGDLLDPAALAAGLDPVGRREMTRFDLGPESAERARGGEREMAYRLGAWAAEGGPGNYASASNDLAASGTSGASAALHFGCVSPARLEALALARRTAPPGDEAPPGSPDEGIDAFVRQLCWRDFYHAVTGAFPAIAREDYRRRPIAWREDADELDAWREGRTGVALVDAAMAQLRREGFVHNRARLVAASYLTKTLRHHWREGADHYLRWLTDADIANNSGNWQWMAGTGNDTRPNRVLNPERQAERFDPDGTYRSRYLSPPPARPAGDGATAASTDRSPPRR
jgi:deoxyribodipyrimidine photo-lyase